MTNVIEYITTGMGDGGAETLIKDYALMLDSTKFKVTIVTINPLILDSANNNRLLGKGIEVIPIYEKPKKFSNIVLQKIWNRFIHKHYVANRLYQIIKEKQADTLHCHLEVLYSVVPIANKISDVKLLWTCHNQPDVIFKPTRWESEEKSAKYLIKNNNMQMIALHDEMRKELDSRFKINNTVVIHNGIDFERFTNVQESKSDIRDSIKIPNDSFVLGHVGRFSKAKNHLFLVDIFKKVKEANNQAHLLLVGAGEFMQQTEHKLIENGLAGSYTILSHRTDIPRLLKAMDVFVFPSLFEGLPVSLVEAQVSGLRTVASNKITEECFFSGKSIAISLDKPAEEWARIILDSNIESNYSNDINLFNMSKEIKRLGKLYEKG